MAAGVRAIPALLAAGADQSRRQGQGPLDATARRPCGSRAPTWPRWPRRSRTLPAAWPPTSQRAREATDAFAAWLERAGALADRAFRASASRTTTGT